jgi:hypothetical protein
MKFTKPINREAQIEGVDFILSFDDKGIELRVKGKRKTASVTWSQVLDIAAAETGEKARDLFGVRAAVAGVAPQESSSATPVETPVVHAQSDGDSDQVSDTEDFDADGDSGWHGRAASAGDTSHES